MGKADFQSDSGDEALAIAALSFLASDPERLGRFLAVTGLGPETLRQAASRPGFLVAVLDYLASDETLLVAFAANAGLEPEAVVRAHRRLGANHAPGQEDFA
ncbi:DUF3572 domain-containing protein [Pseudochelatococcus sp. B33]